MVNKAQKMIERNLNGIIVAQRITDGYLNATKLAKAYELETGVRKDVRDWLLTERSKANVERLSAKTGIPVLELVQVKKGGNLSGTWLHPKLIVPFGTWLSVEYEDQVSDWVEEWMVTGKIPNCTQNDLDRVTYRDTLKDESRLRLTGQIKDYLEKIRRYDDKQYSGKFFARIHDELNKLITTETSQQMRKRLAVMLGREVKEQELIRDYFPSMNLQYYISMCEACANLMLRQGMHPLTAIEEAALIVLPITYKAKPIDFAEPIKLIRGRVEDFRSMDVLESK